jgi:hypothetical protein
MKLTLRELFLLVALVAMGCGWWVRERQLQSRFDLLKEFLAGWPMEQGEKLEVVMDEQGLKSTTFIGGHPQATAEHGVPKDVETIAITVAVTLAIEAPFVLLWSNRKRATPETP